MRFPELTPFRGGVQPPRDPAARPDVPAARRGPAGVALSHRHHVLLVEDHDDTREAIQMALDLLGVRVLAVDNARDGLAALRTGTDYCAVLLDWRMPEMGGEAFIRARIGDDAVVRVPVIAVTGDGLPPDRGTEL